MQTSTRLIPLTQGQFAIVDEVDYDWLMQWKWHAEKKPNSCYARRNGPGRPRTHIYMHREIAKRAAIPESALYDHADRNGLNNTRQNIRPCTRAQNMANAGKQSGTRSVYKGVSWHQSGNWYATIRLGGKRLSLGYFKSEDEAGKAYAEAARKYHGEFAFLDRR